jgi:hypothetical protein
MYADPDTLLEDVQLTLENEAKFYRWCNLKSSRPFGTTNLETADEVHWKNALRYYYHPAGDLSSSQRKFLREYFIWRYRTDQKTPAPTYRKDPPSPLKSLNVTPTEKPVSTKLTFKTQFLLNGVPIEQHTKEAVYEAIAAEEKRIAKLREIQHQPKSLVKEIEEAEAALVALVAHLDGF